MGAWSAQLAPSPPAKRLYRWGSISKRQRKPGGSINTRSAGFKSSGWPLSPTAGRTDRPSAPAPAPSRTRLWRLWRGECGITAGGAMKPWPKTKAAGLRHADVRIEPGGRGAGAIGRGVGQKAADLGKRVGIHIAVLETPTSPWRPGHCSPIRPKWPIAARPHNRCWPA